MEREKAVIYARFSSSGQREESIEGQLRDCHAYAEQNGLVVVGEYCDRAKTATLDRRPEFQKMIRDSEKKQFTVVLAWKGDRLFRNRYDAAIYKRKLKMNGIHVLYARETIPEGPEGIVFEAMMEGMAEYYSANLAQNVKRGNRESALKLQTVGQHCYGLRKGADKRFEIDPATAPIVRQIFERYAAGERTAQIVQWLNSNGHRTLWGHEFTPSTINRMLRIEKYCGVYDFAGVRDENGIPAIVSKELFREVQAMLERHKRQPSSKNIETGFLLTTKLFCGECGQPMTGDGGTSKSGKVYSYYICNGRRRRQCNKERAAKQWIEDLVVDKLMEVAGDPAIIDEFADRFMAWQSKQGEPPERQGLIDRRKEVEKAIDNNIKAIDQGLVSSRIQSHLLDLEAELADIEAGISALDLKMPKVKREEVVAFLSKFREGQRDDPKWRLFLVETFLRAAYLFDDGRLIIELNFSGSKNRISFSNITKIATGGVVKCSSKDSVGLPEGANLNTSITVFDGCLILFCRTCQKA